jgi:CCR4-NOT transcription complex subunit 3
MSSAKKLQGEIDRVLKAVAEGQEVFEEIWQKVHEASTAAQKEKFEGELKTQIKKLQRLREQIKSWITGDQVKDKQPLMDARKRIESDMERFKICEKETKTKAYSKDGLAAANNNDPETRARMEAREWVEGCLDGLQTQKDAHEAEIEVIRSKQKKNSKVCVCVCVRASVRPCVRASMRPCVRASVVACMCVVECVCVCVKEKSKVAPTRRAPAHCLPRAAPPNPHSNPHRTSRTA